MGRRAAGLAADQKQKISLGRGLVREDVAAILFDEPLTVIDPHLKWLLRRKLKEVHERFRRTLVYVTHDQNEALTFADRVVVMLDGEVLQVGTPQELFEEPAHRFVGYFIGSPGMNFVPLERHAAGFALAGTEILLPGGRSTRSHERPGKVELGIRPEFLELRSAPAADTLAAEVEGVRDLGNFKLVAARVGPHRLTAKVADGVPVPAGRIHLGFPPHRVKLYADGRLDGRAE
jgi:glycerol transport system ATP-binding protein